MVEAIPSLSPSQRQAMGHAVIVLAQRAAIEATKQRLRSQGLKPQHFAYREIVALAEAYLLEHRAELIADAKAIVDRWHAEGMFVPRGASDRVLHAVFVMFQNYEHSLTAKATKKAETANERRHADDREPNTAPTAEFNLSAARVLDGDGGGEVDRGCAQARS
jgi:hypothetical protein